MGNGGKKIYLYGNFTLFLSYCLWDNIEQNCLLHNWETELRNGHKNTLTNGKIILQTSYFIIRTRNKNYIYTTKIPSNPHTDNPPICVWSLYIYREYDIKPLRSILHTYSMVYGVKYTYYMLECISWSVQVRCGGDVWQWLYPPTVAPFESPA